MNPSLIHVNPERLGMIADQLVMFSSDVKAELAELDSALRQLGESWRDDEYQAFRKAMQPLHNTLDRFVEEITKSRPQLLADAQAIREYQSIKPS